MSARKLFVSFKMAERCNLVCDYCYFFFQGDESHRDNPAIISEPTVREVARFLGEGARDLGIGRVEIALHGGEPLLVGKKRFKRYCEILREGITPHAQLQLAVQTNGVLLDEEWIRLCVDQGVGIGISLDGPKHINDAARIDRKGRGSYDKIRHAIQLLHQAKQAGKIRGFGALIMIRPDTSAREIYRHVVDELNIRSLDFMLPKSSWDSHSPAFTKFIEQYSLELLECWLEDDDPTINIRSLKFIFAPFLTDLAIDVTSNYIADLTEAISVRSNGDVSPDDTLPSLGPTYRSTGYNVATSRLADFYNAPFWDDIRRTVTEPPTKCAACKWLGFCGGGEIVTRYSTQNKFNNPTIYCERNTRLYERVHEHLKGFLDEAVLEERIQRSRRSLIDSFA